MFNRIIGWIKYGSPRCCNKKMKYIKTGKTEHRFFAYKCNTCNMIVLYFNDSKLNSRDELRTQYKDWIMVTLQALVKEDCECQK